MSWQTTRVTALKLPGLPFALEPAGSPPPGCRVRHGVMLTLNAPAGTDLFVDPAGADPGQVPDAGRLVGLPPAGDFTLAARVSVEFGSMYDAGVLLLHAAERQWAKLCFEYSPQLRPTAVTVVTRGTSDEQQLFRGGRQHLVAADHAVRRGLGLPRRHRRGVVAAAALLRPLREIPRKWSRSASWPSPRPGKDARSRSTR